MNEMRGPWYSYVYLYMCVHDDDMVMVYKTQK